MIFIDDQDRWGQLGPLRGFSSAVLTDAVLSPTSPALHKRSNGVEYRPNEKFLMGDFMVNLFAGPTYLSDFPVGVWVNHGI